MYKYLFRFPTHLLFAIANVANNSIVGPHLLEVPYMDGNLNIIQIVHIRHW